MKNFTIDEVAVPESDGTHSSKYALQVNRWIVSTKVPRFERATRLLEKMTDQAFEDITKVVQVENLYGEFCVSTLIEGMKKVLGALRGGWGRTAAPQLVTLELRSPPGAPS